MALAHLTSPGLSACRRFFQIPVAAVSANPLAIYHYTPESPAGQMRADEIELITPETYQELTSLPKAPLGWYRKLAAEGRRGAGFVFVPHVLVKGPVSIAGGEIMVSRGHVHQLADLSSLIAWADGQRIGAATYRVEGDACELLSINNVSTIKGVGTALLAAFERAAREAGARRLWLITTNDNLDALKFYQRRGYRLAAIYPDAVDHARKIKPTIPEVGFHGIPLHDELELEKKLP